MSNRLEVDSYYRDLAGSLEIEPISDAEIEQANRNRKPFRISFAVLLLVAALLTILLIVGKKAVDPSYDANLFASPGIELNPAMRATTDVPFRSFARAAGMTIEGPSSKRVGIALISEATLKDLEGATVRAEWTVRARQLGKPWVELLAVTRPESVVPTGTTQQTTLRAWFAEPAEISIVEAHVRLAPFGKLLSSTGKKRRLVVIPRRHLVSFQGRGFAVDAPPWTVDRRNDVSRSNPRRSGSELIGPGGEQLLIDYTRGARGDPRRRALNRERQKSKRADYRRLSFRPVRTGNSHGFEWCYTVARKISCDLFAFKRQGGFAISATTSSVDLSRALVRAVSETIRRR